MAMFLTPIGRKKRIVALLKRNGWTWYRLAKEMNMDESTIYRAFKQVDGAKEYDPSLKTLKALARAFHVSVGFFVDTDLR